MTTIHTYHTKDGYRITNGKLNITTTTSYSAGLVADAMSDEWPLRHIQALVD